MDCSPPGSSVHGILQARTREWVAVPSSRGSSRPRDGTCIFCVGRRILPAEPPGSPCSLDTGFSPLLLLSVHPGYQLCSLGLPFTGNLGLFPLVEGASLGFRASSLARVCDFSLLAVVLSFPRQSPLVQSGTGAHPWTNGQNMGQYRWLFLLQPCRWFEEIASGRANGRLADGSQS